MYLLRWPAQLTVCRNTRTMFDWLRLTFIMDNTRIPRFNLRTSFLWKGVCVCVCMWVCECVRVSVSLCMSVWTWVAFSTMKFIAILIKLCFWFHDILFWSNTDRNNIQGAYRAILKEDQNFTEKGNRIVQKF